MCRDLIDRKKKGISWKIYVYKVGRYPIMWEINPGHGVLGGN